MRTNTTLTTIKEEYNLLIFITKTPDVFNIGSFVLVIDSTSLYLEFI